VRAPPGLKPKKGKSVVLSVGAPSAIFEAGQKKTKRWVWGFKKGYLKVT
jgi:hypothetical protein